MKKLHSLKPNRTTRLTLFSTAVITVIMFIVQLFLLAGADPQSSFWAALFALPITALLAYVISSVVIDKALNPVRLMIEKIKAVGNMDFSEPLVVYDESEDVREYANAFNHMAHTLNGYIERQKRFISDASHELATPLTVINGHADMLLRRGKDNPELYESGLAVIKAEALRMNELVESLLMLARSDSGKQVYAFAPVDMEKLLEELIAETRLIAPDFVFESDIEAGLTATCDENAIRRVVRILLSNAVKYSGDSGKITVTAHKTHTLVHIAVRDDGMGIAPEHLPRIFERFYRVDAARTQKTLSSGLGLAIAREIVSAHGGDIRCESVVGKGTAFTVVLH